MLGKVPLVKELRSEGNLIVPINGEGGDPVVLEVSLILQLMAYSPVE